MCYIFPVMKIYITLVSVFAGFTACFAANTETYCREYTYSSDLSPPFHNFYDSTFLEISGKVIDKRDNKAISYANILIYGTNRGTVTNSEGDFIVKIPISYENPALQISSIGYETLTISLTVLQASGNLIFLEPKVYSLGEVEIKTLDPLNLLREALRRIPLNYGGTPLMVTAFYRETVKQNADYVSVSEAVFDVYKSGYRRAFDTDRIKIYKGRKNQDLAPVDTVLFKLKGGPYNAFRLDLIKYPGEILSPTMFDCYDYKLEGFITIDGRNAYVVSFRQKEDETLSLYQGNIYIDTESRAIITLEFSLSDIALKNAADFLIVRKPAGMSVEVINADYRVNYRYAGKRWILNHVRADLNFKCQWSKRFIKLYNLPEVTIYNTMFEMAITDVDTLNVTRYKLREVSKPGEIFVEKVSDFEDPKFWGDYNIIRPEQPIEMAIERLGDKLRR